MTAVGDGEKAAPLSEGDEKLDALVQQASTPNLASLLRKGKESGLIRPVQQYGDSKS